MEVLWGIQSYLQFFLESHMWYWKSENYITNYELFQTSCNIP
jgi:hypothetical protein